MNDKKLYIAGMGMITAVGPTVATSVAAVRAGRSGYSISDYDAHDGEPIIMARVPDRVFEHIDCDLEEEGDVYNYRRERMIRMAIVALRESVSARNTQAAVPFVVALPEDHRNDEGHTPLVPALVQNLQPWIKLDLSRRICTGRSAGIEALDFAFNYLMNQPQEYVLLAGVDSYLDESIIKNYQRRLLTHGAADAFAPGEGACALLLTRHIELAENRNGHVIAIYPCGMAEEEGHMYSEKPYKGEGLDKAFKRALENHSPHSIETIYSSMNGENHWAKEYGVAYLRNKQKFIDKVKIEHPADCYGDLGAATATALVAFAAENLHKTRSAHKNLVYCSSDKAVRGAVVLEKIAARAEHDGYQ
jgi:3-oxoacyl-[acyl-carrier-protein] synthase-1